MIQSRARPSHPGVDVPPGERVVDLIVDPQEAQGLSQEAATLPAVILSARSMCDLELLAVGAFSPLDRFLGRVDYHRVLEEMRLADGTLWPMPITLPVSPSPEVRLDRRVALRSARYELLAILTIEEIYEWDLTQEARAVAGTTDVRHPLVAEMSSWGSVCLSGRLQAVTLPRHHDFVDLRRTPAQLRQLFQELQADRVVAFQPNGPLTLQDERFAKAAAKRYRATLLLNPIVGMEHAGDIDHFTRVRACRAVVEKYCEPRSTVLSLWPLAVRHAGPREALWKAVVSRNYGVSHLVVLSDQCGAGSDSNGHSFYGKKGSQELVRQFEGETGVTMIPDTGLPQAGPPLNRASSCATDSETSVPSVEWRPEVERLVAQAFPPPDRSGFCVWLTGLSGAGKSSIAEVLVLLLMEYGRQVTILDGDVVRTHLSKGLTFSKEDRDMNIRRIGFVAAEIVRHHGVVVCAAVSPYRSTRNEVRSMMGEWQFVEVYVNTPIEICERRDTKGMYAKARKGELRGFTGVDDPYEAPVRPELCLTTADCTPEDNAKRIVTLLRHRGFVSDEGAN
jgi:sulfate adenylyltransferase